MNFKELLSRAKDRDAVSVERIAEMYQPLLIKESVVQGVFDEDLYQELRLTLLNCIEKIRI